MSRLEILWYVLDMLLSNDSDSIINMKDDDIDSGGDDDDDIERVQENNEK